MVWEVRDFQEVFKMNPVNLIRDRCYSFEYFGVKEVGLISALASKIRGGSVIK